MCAHTAASSELTLETAGGQRPAGHPAAADRDPVRAVTRAGARHAPAAPADAAQPPAALPGRAVGARWAWTAGRATTCTPRYPVASCPCDDRNLHFFIARDEADAFARQRVRRRHEARRRGHGAGARRATSCWPRATRPLVFAACDTGFAPIKSLIEHALALDAAPSLSLFWLATRPDGHFLANQCRAWSEALDSFEVGAVHARRCGRRARSRSRRRCGPTCSTSTATSTWPGRRPSSSALRRRAACRRRAAGADLRRGALNADRVNAMARRAAAALRRRRVLRAARAGPEHGARVQRRRDHHHRARGPGARRLLRAGLAWARSGPSGSCAGAARAGCCMR